MTELERCKIFRNPRGSASVSIPQSALIYKITKLEEKASKNCMGCGAPKCGVCLAREYLSSLDRMASRGVECAL